MNNQRLINILTFYGLKPFPKMIEWIKKAIAEDDKDDVKYCKDQVIENRKSSGKSPEGTNFSN